MRRSAALLLFAALCLLHPGKPAAAGEPDRSISLQPGLPDIGAARRLGLQEPRKATLSDAPGGLPVDVVCGRKPEGDDVCWVFLVLPDKTVEAVKVPLHKEASGVLTAAAKVRLTPDSDAETPLELRLAPASNTLLYRWAGTLVSRVVRGQVLPELPVTTLAGKGWSTGKLKGSVVVLNSWGTWCTPCVAEIPELNRVAEKYAGSRVHFVAIANDTAERVEGFLQKRSFLYEQALATDGSKQVLRDYYPRNIVLDADGKVVLDLTGGTENVGEQLEAALRPLVKSAKPTP